MLKHCLFILAVDILLSGCSMLPQEVEQPLLFKTRVGLENSDQEAMEQGATHTLQAVNPIPQAKVATAHTSHPFDSQSTTRGLAFYEVRHYYDCNNDGLVDIETRQLSSSTISLVDQNYDGRYDLSVYSGGRYFRQSVDQPVTKNVPISSCDDNMIYKR